jgi:hypothetical protein
MRCVRLATVENKELLNLLEAVNSDHLQKLELEITAMMFNVALFVAILATASAFMPTNVLRSSRCL